MQTNFFNRVKVFLKQGPAPLGPKIFHLSLIFFLTLTIVGLLSATQVDPHHDGIMLKPAIDVANGKMFARDTFSLYGALSTLIQAAAIKLFGEYLLVIRLLTALFYGLISITIWLIFSRVLPNRLNTFSCIIWLSLSYFWFNHPAMLVFPWPTVYAVFAILLSLYFLILFLERQNYLLLFAAGVVSSLSFWFKINYGAISFTFMFLLLIVLNIFNNRKNALAVLSVFLLGYSVTGAVFVVWLAVNGALQDFILQSVRLASAFSEENKFSSNDPFAVCIIKSLFQIGSTHGGATAIWTVLPSIGTAVLIYSICNYFIKRKNASLTDKIVLSISFMSAGLWLGYYPINALFHMSLSSVLFVGLVSWGVWKLVERAHIKGGTFVAAAIVLLIVLPDLSFKMRNGLRKISILKEFERIERPEFLRGMYVPKAEKKVYGRIDELISQYPDYDLINQTNGGLHSLYKDNNNNEFQKMYADFEWNSTYVMGPDYLLKLNEQILRRSSIILSGDNLIVEGYVPIRVFPELNGGYELAQPTIFLVPGKTEDMFEIMDIEKRPSIYNDRYIFHIKLKPKSKESIRVNSIVIKIFTEDNIPEEINKYEFNYGVVPSILNKEDRQFIKESYSFDEVKNRYSIPETKDENLTNRLIDIFSKIFMYEKLFYMADTFKYTGNTKIGVFLNENFLNKNFIRYAALYRYADSLNFSCSDKDVIDLTVPVAEVPEKYSITLRINYNGNYYYEKTVRSF